MIQLIVFVSALTIQSTTDVIQLIVFVSALTIQSKIDTIQLIVFVSALTIASQTHRHVPLLSVGATAAVTLTLQTQVL